MNHFFCVIVGSGKVYFLWRQFLPSSVNGVLQWKLDKKGEKDFLAVFQTASVTCRNELEAEVEGQAKAKPTTIGAIWIKDRARLWFYGEVYEPHRFQAKLNGSPEYHKAYDDHLNTYTGWAVTPEIAARFNYQLYVKRACVEGRFADLRPSVGWFHLLFVERRNLVDLQKEYPDLSVGDLVTVYGGLPTNPIARGPPWMKNPHWQTDHLPLQMKLRNINFNYYFQTIPPNMEGVLPVEEETPEAIFELWFGQKHQPTNDCGISVAPILHWIFHCMANGNEKIFLYIINWMAVWRQMKNEGSGNSTCLVQRSHPGTGKTSIVHCLGAMVGSEGFYETSECTDLTGFFTAQLAGKILVHFDEAKVAKPEDMNKLKSIITGDSVRQRRLQTNVEMVTKHFSTIMSANMHIVLAADPGERRFVFLEYPLTLAGCKNYLTAQSRVMFGDGQFEFSGDNRYDQNRPGPGVHLLAHYLDNWEIDESVSLLTIPHNKTLYLHQLNTMSTVAQWWFEKLRSGEHIDPTALDDTKSVDIQRNRLKLQMLSAQEAFFSEYQSVDFQRKPHHNNGDLWQNLTYDKDGEPEYATWAISGLLKPVIRFGGDKTACGFANDRTFFLAVQSPKIEFFLALGNGDVTVAEGSKFQSSKKLARARFMTSIMKEQSWLRFVYREQFYNLYVTQSANRRQPGLPSIVTEHKFWEYMKDLTAIDGHAVAGCNLSVRKRVPKGFISREQVSNLLNLNPQRDEPDQMVTRYYVQLDCLLVHRNAFFSYMQWDPVMRESVWESEEEMAINIGTEKMPPPWLWFGDKQKQSFI